MTTTLAIGDDLRAAVTTLVLVLWGAFLRYLKVDSKLPTGVVARYWPRLKPSEALPQRNWYGEFGNTIP